MKKFLPILLAAALMLGLCGCGNFVSLMPGAEIIVDAGSDPDETGMEETPAQETFAEQKVYDFMGWSDFGANFYSDTPIALSFQYNGGSEGCISPIFDRASIIAACEALGNMVVTGKADEGDNADEMVFVFTMADGRTRTVTFDHGNLSLYTGDYAVRGGEELFDLAFPAYSTEFDVFDLYYDADIRAFADAFYENTPVSVGHRAGGGAILTSTEPEAVAAVFEALRGATVILVENTPDKFVDVTAVQDYIFTMEDGTTYTFSFAQQCLVVTANSGYGPVYYWLGNIEPLWEIEIQPETTTGKFEGGIVSGIREDFAEASSIANGGESDLEIIGVHVSYEIDGQSGYLTLSGDIAESIVRTVTSIGVTSEKVAEPTGDVVTVSVTLSDWSGPIFYFVGDTIQEVIGTTYVCDSDQMAMLRTTVLDLAAEGNADVEVDD